MQRLKGSVNLLLDTVGEITGLVERTHNAVANRVFEPLSKAQPTALVSSGVRRVHDTAAGSAYQGVRGVSQAINALVDLGFRAQQQLVPDDDAAAAREPATDASGNTPAEQSRWMDDAEAALNAMYGDYLNRRGNALDIGMTLRQSGKPLAIERRVLSKKFDSPSGKIVVFIHGWGCTENVWNISAEAFYGDPRTNFGSMLGTERGYTPLYLRYNTGRHVSDNGRLLSGMLTQLVTEYPVDIEEFVLVGHSMGGLVARSAAHYGAEGDAPWIETLRHIFCVGSPHLGAPLEKGVNLLSSCLGAFETAATQVIAELINARSSGVKDLRFGYTIEEEWAGTEPDGFLEDHRQAVPQLEHVAYHSIAATVTEDPGHPLGLLLGDLLVRLPSAAGRAREPGRQVPFRSARVTPGMTHLQMANHPDVYHAIDQRLAGGQGAPRPAT